MANIIKTLTLAAAPALFAAMAAQADPVFVYLDAQHTQTQLPQCRNSRPRDVVVMRKDSGDANEHAIIPQEDKTINDKSSMPSYPNASVSLHCDENGGWWAY